MAFDQRGLDDYIDVPQRIADFRAKHADGSLQRDGSYEIVRVPNGWCVKCKGQQVVGAGKQNGKQQWKKCPRCDGSGVRRQDEPQEDVFIVYTATAYRREEDAKPGMGTAWEPYPGQTPYTSGSELMNAETSAWGRAIVATLAADAKRSVSSREEVRNRAAEHDEEGDWRHPPPRPLAQLPRNEDGSLSRSRITDEELDAAGAMTTAQQKEHTALRKGAVTGKSAGKVERVKGNAPDDEFTTPAVTDQEWLGRIEDDIRTFADDDAGEVLRRRVVEKAEAGGCAKDDGEKLRTLIRARRQALKVEVAEPAETADA